jgi:site-specific DNA recombinase
MIRRQPAAGAAPAAPAAHSRPPGGPGGPTAGVGPLLALPQRLAFLGRVSTVDQQDPTLSIPRQLRNAHAALPPGAEIVAHFYDVESGRKDLDERGRGAAHERFAIAVPRDGGLGDLLAEAARPDRRFDGVICESIERVARRTYDGTKVEHDLERVGVTLLAADEPLLTSGKRATQVITRRIKQGLAEWYVLEVLEKSRDGLCEHTRQGYNIGRPPYGYLAERVPHPVPAKRSQGATKSRLRLDPVRAPVVAQIFAWRVTEQLGYRTIASRLNADPGRYPPPIPNRPQAAKGVWCASTVSDILHNPKYTGYMVWNRVAESTSGRRNPPEGWVWSPAPTHPAIVPRELFERAAAVGQHRVGSRDGDGANLAHPDTRRSYLLRSMVVCAHCDRRMRGRTIQQRRYTYYTCRPAEAHGPRAQELWPDHPKSISVREDYLLDGILDFFAKTVFHPERHQRLADQLATADVHGLRAAERQRAALQRTIDDLDARARRLVRALELNAALDEDRGGGVALAEVHGRLAELQRQREATARDLATLDNQQQPADSGAVELLDALPVGTIALQGVPEPTLRRLFVAFQLRVRYDKHANWATLRVTLQEDRLDELLAVAGAITDPQQPLAHGDGIDDSPPFAHASPVPGATQSGKTTTLNCLAAAIPPRERVITCEEVFELQVGLPDTVAMQTRQPNLEGEGEIRQRRLIKEALRMRPDRLLVGEVRQEECLDLLIAFNSGIPGMTSVHANSAREALVKLTTLPLLAGENVSHRFILPTVASTIDLIVFLRADGWGRRRVEEVLAVSGRVEEDQVEAGLVFRRAGDRLLWTGEFPPHGERFRNHGFELVEVLAT